ncbi:class I SAM-dependent methyltransferase [Bosea caraganae]|uniref:Class I SAM-dependent methyltransferase n=1 Tax=Bosea caraganae TaxID=2763117 RepID=A0A370LC17_9HYPH|nr:class I SAM-dependent methyltransferase [Bosea caraganae]RDJ27502.1 class I SAM-dependent methyltransferase [Bosea caraganae]RDJ29517.1 class I SAM-dependent methyltransferase [Bosea caraganae]
MTQNIYDDAGFFENYSQLPRSVHGLDGAPEWGSLRKLLPPMQGLRVIDLGCGFGWFCRWAAEQGAKGVLGVDVSEQMLARARAETSNPAIAYLRADLETFAPEQGAFDLAYSSLAFHYLSDLGGLLARVHAALAPGGALVCSVEHPMLTAPRHQGWAQDASGLPSWPVGAYLDEGPRSTDWLAKGVIKQHRTIATYLALLSQSGLRLTCLEEWGPSPEQVAANPDWIKERQRPPFLLLACRRP